MLAVVLAGVLAASTPPDSAATAAAADTSIRVTGTVLRFGLALEDVDRRAPVHAVQSPVPGAVARAGRIRFFGVETDAMLVFERGRLSSATFSGGDLSPASSAYIEDQLAGMGFRRRCSTWSATTHICDWSGRTELHVEVSGSTLRAEVRPGKPAPAPATSHGGTPASDTLAFVHPGSAPAVLDSCSAQRPAAARDAGIYGRVAVQALVDTSGAVTAVHVTRSVPMLDEAALECARRWRFAPFRVGGRALPYHVAMTIRFAG